MQRSPYESSLVPGDGGWGSPAVTVDSPKKDSRRELNLFIRLPAAFIAVITLATLLSIVLHN